MKNLLFIVLIFTFSFFVSCSVLPYSTSSLTASVAKEGIAMHDLNIILINKLYEERKLRLGSFFEEKYLPSVIEKYQKIIPDTLNYKKEFPNMLRAILPIINRKKDSLQNTLDKQQQEIITKLNGNYDVYLQAANSLQDLIDSDIRIRKANREALILIEKLSHSGNLESNQIEKMLK